MSGRRGPLTARFWAKVDRNGPIHAVLGTPCWSWLAGTDNHGYGVLAAAYPSKGKKIRAHRVSWEIANETSVPLGLCVLHHCDNGHLGCVNPTHLFLGTHADNMADKKAKGRDVRGERVGGAVLTADDVRQMRRMRTSLGWSTRRIAAAMGVNASTAYAAIVGAHWRHVE